MRGSARVAVLDPLPLFRRGVSDALRSDDILVEAPADIWKWVSQGGQRVIVLTLVSPADWSLLEQLSPQSLVIAVLEVQTVASSIKALRLGAESVIARNATAMMMRRALEAVLEGDAVVPRSVIKALISSSPVSESRGPRISENQVRWVRALASGATVAHLANEEGYSEREMYRLLKKLYDRLGVATRTEALIRANTYGWLDVET